MPDAIAIAEQTAGWGPVQYLVAAVVILGTSVAALFVFYVRATRAHRAEVAALNESNLQTTRETYTVLAQVGSSFPAIERRLEDVHSAIIDMGRRVEQCQQRNR